MGGQRFGMITLDDTPTVELTDRVASAINALNGERFRRWQSFEVLIDGRPLGLLTIGGITTFPVGAGEHRLEIRIDGAVARANERLDALIERMPLIRIVNRWLNSVTRYGAPYHPVDVTVRADHEVRLRPAKGRRLEVVDGPATSSGGAVPAAPPRTTGWVARQEQGLDQGSVHHTGRCRRELRTIEPIPHVAPGTRFTWTGTSSLTESQVRQDAPIKAAIGVDLGAISATLTKDFDVRPARETVEAMTRELSIELPERPHPTSWEVHVFDVWQIAEWRVADGSSTTFEYLSGSVACAYEVEHQRSGAQ